MKISFLILLILTSAPIEAWEVKLEIMTDRPTDQPTDTQTQGVIGKLTFQEEFIQNIYIINMSSYSHHFIVL